MQIRRFEGRCLPIPINEVCAYLSVRGKPDLMLYDKITDCIDELSSVITPRACFDEYEYSAAGNKLSLGFADTVSSDLARQLDGCRKIILIAATVGIEADRLIAKYSLTEPSRAVILQAVGSAAVESWLDILCDELSRDNVTRPRFSCGYGDLELSLQKDIFAALGCEKQLGITLNSSFFMTPTKSVTAIIGVE